MIDIDNNEFFDVIVFPGGEPHLKWKKSLTGQQMVMGLRLLARINNGNDLIKLLVVTDAIKRTQEVYDLHVIIPKFPGSRQDRVSNSGEALTVKVYADIINLQNYTSVTIFDPHSSVTPALLNNCVIGNISALIANIIKKYDYNLVVFPDNGVTKKKKYYLGDLDIDYIECIKNRDTDSGKLSGFRLLDKVPEGANALILDDAIDNGGTAIAIAKLLRENNVNSVAGFFTHATFPKGTDYIYNDGQNILFNKLFTTDSVLKSREGVEVLNLL